MNAEFGGTDLLSGILVKNCQGVYPPSQDTHLLSTILSCSGRVLEIGTGTGILAIYCSRKGASVTAVDITDDAVSCARRNAEENGVDIHIVKSDLFQRVRGKFDEIVFNPPYLPVSDSVKEAVQWNGGEDGFSVIRPFLREAQEYLNAGGRIRMILSDLTDIGSLEDEFRDFIFIPERAMHFEFESIYAYSLVSRDDKQSWQA